eukprot:SAG31_NODE_30986_length_373_cov_2.689781_1_plen_35_part_10
MRAATCGQLRPMRAEAGRSLLKLVARGSANKVVTK